MRTLTTFLGLAALLTAPAAAQPLVVLVDAGSVRLDAAALRADIARETGRDVVGLGDARAASTSETLLLARTGQNEWVLRYQRGDASAVRNQHVAPGSIRTTLARASRELLAGSPRELAPVVITLRSARDWTGQGPDLVDPFVRWDPLAARRFELIEPFAERPAGWEWVEIVDPFAATQLAWSDVLDPWTTH